MNTLVITPAVSWYAVFEKNGKEVQAPVAYWEVMALTDEYGAISIARKALVYHPGKKRLVDAIQHAAFLRLEYEPEIDVARTLSPGEIAAWLRRQGATDKDVKAWTKDIASKMVARRLAEQEFRQLSGKDEL